ncbi:MFS transporter [Amycolatopsis sp. NPDC051903]|uniref:MFS transporter n=1 Tax=Amycolatopsis sp. NPDC051903 TaxID=3363936 RepID=UPI00379B438A
MLESRVVRKLSTRLLPVLIIGYFLAIIDRANLGVAALTMNADLGIGAAAFGFAASVFFVPYVVLEVPSNLALARFGARWWIARILVTWGIISAAHALVWNIPSLYVARALLGAAEAGFFPGVIFYLTLWFPAAYRGRIMATFTAGIPVALIIGTPLSGLILNLEGWAGLHGWQWVYLIEGIPAVLMGVLIPWLLPKSPETAKFLTAEERAWLTETLAREAAQREALGESGSTRRKVLKTLLSPKVLMFAVAYYGLTNLNGAVSTFLPQILKPFGLGNTTTTFVAAIPYVFGLIGMLLLGRLADRPGRRAVSLYVALGVSLVGLAASAVFDAPVVKLVALCVAAFGVFGVLPTFWGLPTAILTGAAAAGGIALINALGNLSSVVNPAVIGAIDAKTGSFDGGLLWLAAMAVVAILAVTVILLVWRPQRHALVSATGSAPKQEV